MECHYHPEREGTDNCAICGKSICKECGLELAGKVYCKECLESIVGLELNKKASETQPSEPEEPVKPSEPAEPVKTEPARLNKQPTDDNVYKPQAESEEVPPAPQPETHEIKQIHDDSPYNVKGSVAYSEEPESSYLHESEVPQEVEPEPQITQAPKQETPDYIYPDHSYEPEPTTARQELEDKYERYLDDLYFDEEEVPLDEQLAQDEKEYGSLTRKPYDPEETPKKHKEAVQQAPPQEEQSLKERSKPRREETPEEMEARLRAEILAEKEEEEKKGKLRGRRGRSRLIDDDDEPETNIHNINYKEEKEPMGAVDILLTLILILVILVVIYYLIYIFVLNATYPTFMDAIYALTNPQNVINNILSPQ